MRKRLRKRKSLAMQKEIINIWYENWSCNYACYGYSYSSFVCWVANVQINDCVDVDDNKEGSTTA